MNSTCQNPNETVEGDCLQEAIESAFALGRAGEDATFASGSEKLRLVWTRGGTLDARLYSDGELFARVEFKTGSGTCNALIHGPCSCQSLTSIWSIDAVAQAIARLARLDSKRPTPLAARLFGWAP